MGPLLNPITLVLAVLIFLAFLAAAALPIPLVSVITGAVYYYVRRRGQRGIGTSDSVLVASVIGALQIVALILLAGPVFLACWFIAGFLMASWSY